MTDEDAFDKFYILDADGLITRKRPGLDMRVLPFAQ